jgi:alkylhydroperoxidase/carboxymuconolactone decarboxylase family protein YurZ
MASIIHDKGEFQMETSEKIRETVLGEKAETLIAIGAATAANCIPCFEHLYEKAVTSGITTTEIKRASKIATLVKGGAHTAISSTIDELTGDELTGSKEANELACGKTSAGSCCC